MTRITTITLLASFLCGCAGHVYDYSDSAASPATVKGYSEFSNFNIRNIFLIEVDKHKIDAFVKNSVRLSPGKHTIFYEFENNSGKYSIGRFDVNLKAGTNYYCDAKLNEVDWVTFNLIEEGTSNIISTVGSDARPKTIVFVP